MCLIIKNYELPVHYLPKQLLKIKSMNCKLLQKNLIGYIEGTISPTLRHLMDDHAKNCHSCSKLIHQVKATYKLIDEISVPEPDPLFYTRLEQRLKTKLKPQARSVSLFEKLKPLAASLLLIIGIGIGFAIGKNLQNVSLTSSEREEILKEYASDYYLSGANEENVYTYLANE